MEIQPIKTEQDYDNALERVETLMSAEPGSPEMDELDILATLINAYEENHFPIDVPDPSRRFYFVWTNWGLVALIWSHILVAAVVFPRCFPGSAVFLSI